MKTEKTIIVFLFLLFLIPISYSVPFNPEGYGDLYFSRSQEHNQNTLFNSNFNNVYGSPILYSKSVLSNMKQSPISYDIDNDGLNELFVASAQTIVIYKTPELIYNSSIVLSDNITHYAFYKDGSNNLKFVIETWVYSAGTFTPKISIYTYNGTFNLQGAFDSPSALGDMITYSRDSNFGCHDDYCIEAIFKSDGRLEIQQFNLTDSGTGTMPILSDDDDSGNMVSTVKNFNINSFNDGTNYYFIIGYRGIVKYNVITAKFSNTGHFISRVQDTLATNCLSETAPGLVYGTNLLLGNFNPNGRYTIAGGYIDTNHRSNIFSAYWDGMHFINYKTHYSIFAHNDIYAISNVFDCKTFPNDQNSNYCMFGYALTNATELITATDFGVPLFNSDTIVGLTYNYSNYYEIISNSIESDAMGINAENRVQSGFILTDFLTPFGVYYFTTPNNFGVSSLIAGFQIPYNIPHAVLSFQSLKNSPFYDIVGLTANNVFYISDKFFIPSAQIDAYTINPCVNQPIQINESVNVQIQPRSYNDYYLVSGKATLYYGNPNAQSYNWTDFYPSNSILSFDFKANVTITNGILRLEAKDNQNTSSTYIDIPFSVSTIGVKFNDCTSTQTGLIAQNTSQTSEEIKYSQNVTMTDNVLREGITEQARSMGIPVLLFVLLLIIGIDVIVFVSSMNSPQLKEHLSAVLIFILFFDLFGIIVLSMMGIINIVFTITMIIILLIIGMMFIAQKFNKATSG